MKHVQNVTILLILLGCFGSAFAQTIEKDWNFSAITNQTGDALFEIAETDVFQLNEGEFNYTLAAKDNLTASGDYILQNNLLVLFYSKPNDTIRRYRITKQTDSTLAFTENNITYSFVTKQNTATTATANIEEASGDNATIPSQGFSFNSLWHGV